MPKFNVGDLIKPKAGTGWDTCGIILAEIVTKSSPGDYKIHIVVMQNNSIPGFHVGEITDAYVEKFFDHV